MRKVMVQIATYTRRLHDVGFVHMDLKWRNIQVTRSDDPRGYLLDCPSGRRQYGFRLKRGIVKDFIRLDMGGRERLTARERLWFYKVYAGLDRISAVDRRTITKILAFFEGRRAWH